MRKTIEINNKVLPVLLINTFAKMMPDYSKLLSCSIMDDLT